MERPFIHNPTDFSQTGNKVLHGKDTIVLAEDEVDLFLTDGIVMFYSLKNGKLYRKYLPDGTTDLIADCENIYYFSVLTNHDISWKVDDGEQAKIDQRYDNHNGLDGIFQFDHFGVYYYKNTLTGRHEATWLIADEEFLLFLDEYLPFMDKLLLFLEEYSTFLDKYKFEVGRWPHTDLNLLRVHSYFYDFVNDTDKVDTSDWYKAHYNYQS